MQFTDFSCVNAGLVYKIDAEVEKHQEMLLNILCKTAKILYLEEND
ncbi:MULTISPECIES: hypothetical protein [Arcicella]|uniref:Uncharacterized protein n=1 Tax=Arcicella lustrica TaxID=2984196 RepID=A0ABU5SJ04_9BACT|nr:hypothetical protein [Arcicella sp. DC25W]MEA5427214.1 hypothetical protein [Arcicella sp. DC25W]